MNIQDFTLSIIYSNWNPISDDINTSLVESQSLMPITTYRDGKSNLFGSYNETLQLQDNAQTTFTFSMAKNVGGALNPYIGDLVIGRELQLYYKNKYYNLIINSITPTFNPDNVYYTFSCIDSCSYFLSKNNVGTDYTDEEEDGVLLTTEFTGKTFYQLVTKIMTMSHLTSYVIDPTMESMHEFPQELYGNEIEARDMVSSLSLTSSNTYNALIETANLFNASMVVEYFKASDNRPNIIKFKNKKTVENTGYRLEPNVNLNSFNLSLSGDNLCTVMHVSGGEDANGEEVTMLPNMPDGFKSYWQSNALLSIAALTANYRDYVKAIFERDLNDEEITYLQALKQIPTASNMLFDFSYFTKAKLMTENVVNDLTKRLTIDYRNANFTIQMYQPQYYNLLRYYQSSVDREEELIAQIAANNEQKRSAVVSGNITQILDTNTGVTTDLIQSIDAKIQDNKQALKLLWANQIEGEDLEYIKSNIAFNDDNNNSNFVVNRRNSYISLRNESIQTFNTLKSKIITLVKEQRKLVSNTIAAIIPNNNETMLNTILDCIYGIATSKDYATLLTYDNTKVVIYGDDMQINQHTIAEYKTALTTLMNGDSTTSTITDKGTEFLQCTQELTNKVYSKIIMDVVTSTSESHELYYGYYVAYIEEMNRLNSYCIGTTSIDPIAQSIHNLYDTNAEVTSIVTQLNKAKVKQQQVLASIKSQYYQYWIESMFTDSNQLSSTGLYMSALSQFLTYNHPITNYSATMIDYDAIVNLGIASLDVGDKLYILHDDLELFYRNNESVQMVYEVDDKVNGWITKINGIDCEILKGISFVRAYSKMSKFYVVLKFDKQFITIDDYSFIKTMVDSKQNTLKVLRYSTYNNDRAVELRVTGITNTLRDATSQLTVENNTAIQSVIDKMILSVRTL